ESKQFFSDFARWSGFPVRAGRSFFCRATVLLADRLGLLFEVKALPSRAPAANCRRLGAAKTFPIYRSVRWPDFVLPTQELNRRATKQRAINLLAHLLEGGFSQSEQFAMQNGKGVKEREGDDFYP